MIGNAKLLKIYIGEKQTYQRKSLYQYLVHWLKQKGIAGVTVIRGIEGYGQEKVLHSVRLIDLSADLPIILEVIDTPEKIESILPEICKIVTKGLVMTTDVQVHK